MTDTDEMLPEELLAFVALCVAFGAGVALAAWAVGKLLRER